MRAPSPAARWAARRHAARFASSSPTRSAIWQHATVTRGTGLDVVSDMAALSLQKRRPSRRVARKPRIAHAERLRAASRPARRRRGRGLASPAVRHVCQRRRTGLWFHPQVSATRDQLVTFSRAKPDLHDRGNYSANSGCRLTARAAISCARSGALVPSSTLNRHLQWRSTARHAVQNELGKSRSRVVRQSQYVQKVTAIMNYARKIVTGGAGDRGGTVCLRYCQPAAGPGRQPGPDAATTGDGE